jgi:hypothetical protein
MSWELLEFTLEETSGPVQVFNFEARLHGGAVTPACQEESQAGAPAPPVEVSFRGDGIYMTRTKQLRINRESELAALLRERFAPPPAPLGVKPRATFDPKPLLAELTELLRARIAAPPVISAQPRPGARLASSPAPAIGSVAYMLRWEQ